MDDKKQSSSGLEFKLHPLVLINISDHHTRTMANSSDGVVRPVLGMLLGTQTGRTVDISNSFEIKYSMGPDGVEIDQEFLIRKTDQYKQVFPKLDVMGWYATGDDLVDQHMLLHRKVMELNESPIFLLLNPKLDNTRKDIPVSLYETELHVVDGAPSFFFVRASYCIETSDAERIGVDHVAKILPSGKSSGSEQLTAHLMSMHSAIKMLNTRVKIIAKVMEDMATGKIPFQHSLVRKVAALTQNLPAASSEAFTKDFLMEYNDALLAVQLSVMTKGITITNDVVDKCNLAYEKAARRPGRSGAALG